jgi:hypothetical protein
MLHGLAVRRRRTGWAPKLALDPRRREHHVVLNNCYCGYAGANARQLAALLAT